MEVISEFESEFKKFTEAKNAIACSSGTSALHTALTAIGIGRGDKVITTPFSFVASANSILFSGAIPIFADIDPETYCIAPKEVGKKLDEYPDTKAILCVHLFGNVCDMHGLMSLAQAYDTFLIEDCAQALGARYHNKHVGNFGEFGCFSFYTSKNLWTFEGGMLTTNNDELAGKARMIINHGRKLGISHEHVILGYNYRMHPLSALMGIEFLKRHKTQIMSELGSYGTEQGCYPYVIYDLPFYRKLGIKGDCPNAEHIAKEVRDGGKE